MHGAGRRITVPWFQSSPPCLMEKRPWIPSLSCSPYPEKAQPQRICGEGSLQSFPRILASCCPLPLVLPTQLFPRVCTGLDPVSFISHLCFSLSLCISAIHDLFWEITVSVHVCFSLTFFFFFPFVFSILSHCQSPFLFVFVSLPLFPSLFLYCSTSLSLSLNLVYFSVYLCPSLLGFSQPSIADVKEYHRHGPSTPALRG